MNQQNKRKFNVLEYLKNPYHLPQKQDKFDIPQTCKSGSRTNQRRFYRPYKHQTLFPELNSTNALYLSKTSQQFRQSRQDWQGELQICLQSQSIRGVPNTSKVTQLFMKSLHNSSSSQLLKKQLPELKPLLEVQAHKLF
ncbi:unnamed protein product (macronuclear) [Paramecium tetraurelia]|uniref:Chromosome undetermined scaffold_1, whole genome shotgun sequence n=1 Tax=Paramecium tetraurelia TaxID=5888 RepID=Q6BFD8_PARTE|nr:hypothetical protein [Paramecium tetraurelia strain d4-2]XP_001422998.1 uncharacterized protein GSPATT00000035001 [Paramecium tetraurelia]CAH03633.1 hypothetical protein PTMB.432-b [Paramecium tetraurelia]CAK55600.1 unnamed protein product [Paramecium tetraurelia]|eukprot:XP_001422998.1 hypothetical protein (macronuclear) [Paramecium tetraurelia strain d4-2]